MSQTTSIEWTDATWNVVTGCRKISAGCVNCYSEREWKRLSANSATQYAGRVFGDVACHSNRLGDPLKWTKPRRVFVASMGDLFHAKVPDEFIDQVFAVMGLCSRHVFQLLTKRADRMMAYMADKERARRVEAAMRTMPWIPAGTMISPLPWPLPNVWLGVSVENQKMADKRVPVLLRTPAAIRFLSVEPLIESVSLAGLVNQRCLVDHPFQASCRLPEHGRTGIDWVICGGESGPKARPMARSWARAIRDQCISAGVPFFFKQNGQWVHVDAITHQDGRQILLGCVLSHRTKRHRFANREVAVRVGKKAAGRLLDGRTWDEMPPLSAGPGETRRSCRIPSPSRGRNRRNSGVCLV